MLAFIIVARIAIVLIAILSSFLFTTLTITNFKNKEYLRGVFFIVLGLSIDIVAIFSVVEMFLLK